MRVIGEMGNKEKDEEEKGRDAELNIQSSADSVGSPLQQELIVGYALTSKKKKSFMQPTLEGLARYIYISSPNSIFYYIVSIYT